MEKQLVQPQILIHQHQSTKTGLLFIYRSNFVKFKKSLDSPADIYIYISLILKIFDILNRTTAEFKLTKIHRFSIIVFNIKIKFRLKEFLLMLHLNFAFPNNTLTITPFT